MVTFIGEDRKEEGGTKGEEVEGLWIGIGAVDS